MRIFTTIFACMTMFVFLLVSVLDSSAQEVRYPAGSVQSGRDGRGNYPGGSVNWGSGNGYVNFPGGSVGWDNRGQGGVRINVPGFNGRIRW
ncbi:MAG: hypothetical protein NTY51_06550 [Deltaproteobacteria bacterium]|nr:hypothetical protein [Deltaproteobacteria bacterium]